MAKYYGPLESAFEFLKNERKNCKGRLALITSGKFKGYKARCKGVVLHETDRLEFIYWFSIFRKDGKGMLSYEDPFVRKGRRQDEFEWI